MNDRGPNDLEQIIEKLEKRYPGGFEAVRSNNKSQDDI